jgi:serpin B
VQGLDFANSEASKRVINGWVEQKTHNRIKNLIENIDRDHVMFLVNAIYFNGDWTYQFDKLKTDDRSFYTPDGEVVTPLMHSKGVKVQRYTNEQLQLVDIPYGNEQFRLTVIMPRNANDLKEVTNGLDGDDINLWLSNAHEEVAELELPKFKMEWKKDLLIDLRAMGMDVNGFPKLFQEQLDLGISAVVHQSFLEVNEEGSEAAAATAVAGQVTSIGPPVTNKIELNKSFVFAIREQHTGIILFLGQLVDPTAL